MYHIAPETELSPLACAYARARGADRMSSFGDWIALSDVCDLSTAKLIQHEVSDGIIAPGYDADALEVLKSKKKGGYAIVQIDADYEPKPLETRTVFGVTFEQGRQDLDISNETMLQNVVTENKGISDEQRRDLIISLIVLKYTQSNSVCYVQDGQTIWREKDVDSKVTVSREVTFSIDINGKKFDSDNITAGSGYSLSRDGNTFTVEEESHGGSSSSGSTRYTVSVEDTDNGSVKVSPTRASKGSTVTVTVKPDEGYELDELTVTDKNGDSVKLTDKGDGKYTFKMPASKVTVEAVFTAVEPEPEGLPFTDVTSGDWFYDAVAYVYDKGMMEGTTDTTFAPTMNLTRSMIAQVLYNLEERPEAPGAAGFPDVAADAWYADAVNWAAARGIVKGYDTGAFGPEDSVTREQLAAILYRYAQVKGYDTTRGGMAVREFSDSASISDWAQEAMAWAVNAQVLSGKGNGVLDPQGTATRAEVAQMLMNFGEHVG